MQAQAKIAAIILAAGGSMRMRKPKLTLEWHGVPLVRWVALLAFSANCSPVIVVTGANREAVALSLDGLPLRFAHNPDWNMGRSRLPD